MRLLQLSRLSRLSFGLVLFACGSGSSNEPRDPPPARTVTPVAVQPRTVELEEPAIALPRELAFELLDAGRGERAPLRYAAGAARPAELAVRTELTTRELTSGTWSKPTKLPSSETRLSSTAITFDDRGRIATPGHRDASADERLQRLLAATVPLPAEAIGEGAKWRVITALRQQGAVLRQTATYTLESRRAPWRISVDIQRLAEPQRAAGVELVAIVRRLRGTLEIDPSDVLPTRGTFDVESTVHVRAGENETIVEDRGAVALARHVAR